MTRKGQITVPVEIRRELGLKEGDFVLFRFEDGRVELTSCGSVTARTAGALRSNVPAVSPEAERAAVEEAIAEDVAAEG